jgi:hypothetical protein
MLKILFYLFFGFLFYVGNTQVRIGCTQGACSSNVLLKYTSIQLDAYPHQEIETEIIDRYNFINLGNFGLLIQGAAKNIVFGLESGLERSYFSYSWTRNVTYTNFSDVNNTHVTSERTDPSSLSSNKNYVTNPYLKLSLGYSFKAKHSFGLFSRSSYLLKSQFGKFDSSKNGYYFTTNKGLSYTIFNPVIAGAYYKLNLTKAISVGAYYSKMIAAFDQKNKFLDVKGNNSGGVFGIDINYLFIRKEKR